LRKFFVGLATGVAIAAALPVAAAQLIGDSGYLLGWSITKDGEEICSDPWMWAGINEIECD